MSNIIKKAIIKGVKKVNRILNTKHIKLDVGELFFQHNGESDFLRYDMIVRLITIEKFCENHDYDFNLYYRMQKARVGEDWANQAVKIFKELIESYEINGYDESSEIVLDKNLQLIDGSHRFALAIFYGYKTISAKVLPEVFNVYYKIEWFQINGFTQSECDMLRARYRDLCPIYARPFVCTLWHPAKPYWEEITKHLAMFGEVREVRDFCFNEAEYKYYTYGIYYVDDIEKWKIDKKISVMHADDADKYYLRMVAIYITTPDFRLKGKTGNTLSKRGELIKALIRKAYKGMIPNYFHDVIMHIGDNFYQSKYIYKLLSMPRIDVSSLLDEINTCQYVITKFNVEYMPEEFPIKYPLGKDIDIVCSDKDNYLIIKKAVENLGEQYKDTYSVRTVLKSNDICGEYRSLVRFEQENFLVFQFDISCRTGKTKAGFEEAIVKDRVKKKNFYITSPSCEILVRLCEIHDYPRKKHHLDYVNKHKEDLDSGLCDRYLDFNWRKIVTWL